MAHATFHFCVGLATGMILLARPVWVAARKDQNLAPSLRTWMIGSYGIAILAVVPNVLRHVGFSDAFCSGWWMNLFLLHPWLDKSQSGGMLIGEAGIALCFVLQYLALVAALQVRRSSRPPPG